MSSLGMSWVFDDPERFVTMSACKHTVYAEDMNNNNGRWNVSNIHWYWRNAGMWYGRDVSAWTAHGLADRPTRYVYPIGGFSSPEWWAGQHGNAHGFIGMFDLIPAEVMQDARDHRVLLLVDNLNEGFHMPWLWEFFHQQCMLHGLPPSTIVWLNSNESEHVAYAAWADARAIAERINVIPFCHLMYQQKIAFSLNAAPTWADHLTRKSRGDVLLYNCLNRIQRPHREYLLLRLLQENLLPLGLVSHDRLRFDIPDDINIGTVNKAQRLLPLVVDDSDFNNNKAMTINPEIYLDTWMSIITETHATDSDHQVFISEKVWKPIYCRHPFMILGNRHSIKIMQDKGYQCPWFDQLSVDDLPFSRRVDHIIQSVKDLRRMQDKLGWYDSLRDACEHNHAVFMKQDFFDSMACDAILRAWRNLA